jgi:hypothetical protein
MNFVRRHSCATHNFRSCKPHDKKKFTGNNGVNSRGFMAEEEEESEAGVRSFMILERGRG